MLRNLIPPHGGDSHTQRGQTKHTTNLEKNGSTFYFSVLIENKLRKTIMIERNKTNTKHNILPYVALPDPRSAEIISAQPLYYRSGGNKGV